MSATMVRGTPMVYMVEESLREGIDRKNYVRAVVLAQKLGHPDSEIRHLQELALNSPFTGACLEANGLRVPKCHWDT